MGSENRSVIPPHIEERRREVSPSLVRQDSRSEKSLTVACILDDLSMTSFGPEADFQPLTMRDWLVELTASQPDLLFVESAWRGHRQTWWNQVQHCGPELTGILEWCASRGVPTVFWNKEDPVHFSTFLNAASRFDVVFTTDVDCVPRYRAALGHDQVYFLPFAAQPWYHNPLAEFDRIDGCSFAGAYYKKYPDRNRDFAELSPVLSENGQFEIYDRNFGTDIEDQKFPLNIRNQVVGGLAPEDISVAYKGYMYSLNLNSVKDSQSMFARRVFELVASNTAVVSNYSRGLSLMFGDLTFSTDGAEYLRERLQWIQGESNGLERLRTMGLRKVLREHTYSRRFQQIIKQAGLETPSQDTNAVLLISLVKSSAEANYLAELIQAQSHQNWHLWLIGSEIDNAWGSDSRIKTATDTAAINCWLIHERIEYCGFLEPNGWYGKEYIADLLDIFSWADVEAAGHSERFTFSGKSMSRVEKGTAWTIQSGMKLGRSLVKFTHGQARSIEGLSSETQVAGVAASTIGYCENGASAEANQLEAVLDLEVNVGLSLDEMQQYARALRPEAELEASGGNESVPPASLFGGWGNVTGLDISSDDDGEILVESSLTDGSHQYVYSKTLLKPFMLPDANGGEVYFEATPGLNVMLTFIYYDENRERLGHSMIGNSRNTPLFWPDGTTDVKVGIRVLGPGACTIRSYSRTPRKAALHTPIRKVKNLVVTNKYPSYESLYQNGFVASRIESYRKLGFETEVFCLEEAKSGVYYREFDGIEIISGNADLLESVTGAGAYENILVHFLSPQIWNALNKTSVAGGVTVWVHGFEAQPWWRRKSNFSDPQSRLEAIQQSEERMGFWSEVFSSAPSGWHFVFVSQYLASQVFEDVGVTLEASQYSIIPNLIDTDLFNYEKKDPGQRFKVLSIRPYASPIYANDLAVQAVLELEKMDPDFEKFEFSFYGDGPLFEETLRPLAEMPNVEIHRGFLTHNQIAAVHKDFGVFLVPSRMDTQGVSRGEAMSSGLVPVTNAVAAIPEFVDVDSGILTEPEDYRGLALALQQLANDREKFSRLSLGAATRVRHELGFKQTVGRELQILNRKRG